jgi:hypothetical protein
VIGDDDDGNAQLEAQRLRSHCRRDVRKPAIRKGVAGFAGRPAPSATAVRGRHANVTL